jgi:uncharacterized protein YutE (UPF0331/DUF86 family)
MSPLDVEIIRRKLGIILENLKALEAIQGMKKEGYIRDIYKRKATERLLQELIEAAIDINTHTIVETGHTAPDDYYQSFILAGEIGIIPPDLAENLAPSAGLRNRLVHEYDGLDHNERGYMAWTFRLLAEIASHPDRPDIEKAENYFRQAMGLAEELGMRPLIAHCHFGLGKLYHRAGKLEQGKTHFSSAMTMYNEMEMRFWPEKIEKCNSALQG